MTRCFRARRRYWHLRQGEVLRCTLPTDQRGILTSCLPSLATCSGRLASKSCHRLLPMASACSLLMSAKWSYSAIANGCFRCDSKKELQKKGFRQAAGAGTRGSRKLTSDSVVLLDFTCCFLVESDRGPQRATTSIFCTTGVHMLLRLA